MIISTWKTVTANIKAFGEDNIDTIDLLRVEREMVITRLMAYQHRSSFRTAFDPITTHSQKYESNQTSSGRRQIEFRPWDSALVEQQKDRYLTGHYLPIITFNMKRDGIICPIVTFEKNGDYGKNVCEELGLSLIGKPSDVITARIIWPKVVAYNNPSLRYSFTQKQREQLRNHIGVLTLIVQGVA